MDGDFHSCTHQVRLLCARWVDTGRTRDPTTQHSSCAVDIRCSEKMQYSPEQLCVCAAVDHLCTAVMHTILLDYYQISSSFMLQQLWLRFFCKGGSTVKLPPNYVLRCNYAVKTL